MKQRVSIFLRHVFRRRGVRILAALAGMTLLGWASWESALRLLPGPTVPAFPRAATFIQDRDGHDLAAFVGQEDAWYVPLSDAEMSTNLKKAIVAAEDRRFYEHHGVDWKSVVGAAWQDASSFRIRRGASTITMQVVRLREPRGRSFASKFEQAFRAEQLELEASKDAILTEYLNRAPFGGNVVGAGAASWHYFGKACADLSLGQAALLAGLPQSPNRFRPDRSPELARQRRTHVLEQMLDMGSITREEFARADAEPIDIRPHQLPQDAFVDANGAMPTLIRLAEANPGAHLRTTIDPGVQQTAFEAASAQFRLLQDSGVDAGAVVVVDVPTADVLASVSLHSKDLDLTTRARSTGSVLKPFFYTAAFHEGILTPTTQVLDSPAAWAGYIPANFDRNFRGKMSAGEALAESRNIPAMLVLSKLTVDSALETLEDFDIRTPINAHRDYGLSLAIGGAEATPVEIASGYATLARGGEAIPVHLIAREGKNPHRVLPQTVCYQTLTCISNPTRTETIENAHDAALRGYAWKTGTSNGFRDAWCAAVSGRHVVVVWFGNAGGSGNSALVGQDAAAPLALHLLAMLEKNSAREQPWPATLAPPRVVAELATNHQLSIVTPAPNIEILTESEQRPRISLKCAGGAGTKRWWFAGDELIAAGAVNVPAFWSPTPGRYTLRVLDESGTAASIKLQVR